MTSMTMTIPRQRSADGHRATPAPVVRRSTPWLDALWIVPLVVAALVAMLSFGCWIVDLLSAFDFRTATSLAELVGWALTAFVAIGGRR